MDTYPCLTRSGALARACVVMCVVPGRKDAAAWRPAAARSSPPAEARFELVPLVALEDPRGRAALALLNLALGFREPAESVGEDPALVQPALRRLHDLLPRDQLVSIPTEPCEVVEDAFGAEEALVEHQSALRLAVHPGNDLRRAVNQLGRR